MTDDVDVLERLLEERFEELLDQLAPRVAAELDRLRPPPPPARAERLVGTGAVARYLNVNEQWVRAHAKQLRARRLARSTWRFSLVEIDELLLQAAIDGTTGG